MAMGQQPNRLAPSDDPNPTTKRGPKMGGAFTCHPKWDPNTVLTTTAMLAGAMVKREPQSGRPPTSGALLGFFATFWGPF